MSFLGPWDDFVEERAVLPVLRREARKRQDPSVILAEKISRICYNLKRVLRVPVPPVSRAVEPPLEMHLVSRILRIGGCAEIPMRPRWQRDITEHEIGRNVERLSLNRNRAPFRSKELSSHVP